MSWIDSKGLVEQQHALVGKAGEIVRSANGNMTPEQDAEFTRLHAEASALEERVNKIKQQNEAEKSVEDLIGRSMESPKSVDVKEVATRAFYKKFTGRKIDGSEERALASVGSAFVPNELLNVFIDVQKYDGGPIEAGCTVHRTPHGNPIPIPKIDDTAQTGEMVAESAGLSAAITDPTVGTVTLNSYIYDSGILKVPVALERDAYFTLDQWVAPQLFRRVARKYNSDLTLADGSSKPQGCIYGGTVGKTTSSTTAVTYNEFLDLIHSVDRFYRNPAKARLMFNDTTLLYMKKMVDGAGNPLWNAGNVGAGIPATLDGYQYVINPYMASVGTTAYKFAAFGDFGEGYAVRLVNDITLTFLDQLYMANLQHGYVAHVFIDGKVTNASAYKVMAHA